MHASVHRIEVCQDGPAEYVMKIWFQAPYGEVEEVEEIANAAMDFFCRESEREGSGLPEPIEEDPVYEVD